MSRGGDVAGCGIKTKIFRLIGNNADRLPHQSFQKQYSTCLLFSHVWCLMAIWYFHFYLFLGNHPEFGGSDGKESAYNAGELGSIPGLGRSPGEGKGYPLQYSCLENPRDRGAWRARKELDTTEQPTLSLGNQVAYNIFMLILKVPAGLGFWNSQHYNMPWNIIEFRYPDT